MEWNIIWKQKKNGKQMKWYQFNCCILNELKRIVVCDAHWKFHCVYHETEMFSKRMKRNKVEWIDIPLIHNTISMSFCVITQQISTFSFLFFSNQKYSSKFPYKIGLRKCFLPIWLFSFENNYFCCLGKRR